MSFDIAAQRFAFEVDERKPEILLITGIICIVTGGVMACKATLKARDILEEHRTEMSDIRELEEIKEELTEEEQEKIPVLKTNQYVRTTIEFVKDYAPAVVITTLGIVSICYSHHIMNERNVALSMALGSANAALLEYRGRVRNEIGTEAEQMIFDGGHREKYEIEVDKGDGKKPKKEVVDKIVYDKAPVSPWSVMFDEKSRWWRENNPIANRLVVENVQKNANMMLHSRGYVTLAEVLNDLGFELDMKNDIHAKDYLVMGWKDAPEDQPMKVIDFGLETARTKGFGVDEDSAWLTFNVDPEPIWHSHGTKFGSLTYKEGRHFA